MSSLAFHWPYAALLLLLLPLFWRVGGSSGAAYLVNPHTKMLKQLSGNALKTWRVRTVKIWPSILWSLMVLALMRPQVVGEVIELPREGRNLMLVVDISESMTTPDMTIEGQQVDRLTALKILLGDFIDRRFGDRMGLVLFGTETFLHAPLTFDHQTIKKFLYEAQIGFAGPRTAIGDALGLGVKKLLNEPDGDRVIILLTDGQNNSGKVEPQNAAVIAKNHRIKIYAVGMGSSKMQTEGFFGRTAVNPSMDLDQYEPTLKALTTMTGGQYFRGKDTQGLAQIYEELDRLEPVVTKPIKILPKEDLYYWVLALLPLLMIMRRLLALLVRGKVAHA
jgi:Ca-activated chloride channel family protein